MRASTCLCLALFAMTAFGQAPLPENLERIRQTSGSPSLAAAVVVKDGTVHATVVGLREIGKPERAERTDRYALGSLTKHMTALMVFRLIDAGKLRLDQTIAESLPGISIRDAYRSVTLEQLLTFRGGIPAYIRIGPRVTPILFELKGDAEAQRRQFVAHVLNEEPAATPGTKMVYSNASYALLGLIASQATGKSWEELVRAEVFAPIGLKSAGFGQPRSEDRPHNVSGHMRTPEGLVPRPILDNPAMAAAGAVYSDIEDLGRFAAECLRIGRGESKLLKPTSQKAMATISGFTDGSVSAGGGGMFLAEIGLWPSKNKAVVVATNAPDEAVCERAIAELSGELMFGAEPTPEGIRVTEVPPGSIADRVGLKAGDLIVEIDGKPIVPGERVRARIDAAKALTVLREGKKVVVRLVQTWN